MIIGIDLGTTNSVAACMADDGPRLIPNALGESLTPSVVGIDEAGELLVGRAAKEYQVLHPQRCAATFKRYMGSDRKERLGDREFSPEQLSSLVLRSIKEDAEAFLGQAVLEAVITVPAYFNEPQRQATLNAGQMAGLNVRRILNEPTAAALAYGFHGMQDEKVLGVIDLGGGTFDVAIVDLFEGALEVRASSGETFLGGEDFSRTLAARILERTGVMFERAELDTPKLVSRLMQQCEAAKRELSRQASVSVRMPDRNGEFQDGSPLVKVDREQFEQWTRHILARIDLPIRRALGDSRLKRSDLDEVILVGGATRMPMLVERITQLFGKEPQCRLNPDEVVALGAAVQAGLIVAHKAVDEMVVTDVSPFTLGIEISKTIGLEKRSGYFLPIIHRNMTIPISRVNRVTTISPNQTQVKVCVYQGENRRVESNLLLGEFTVNDIPRGPAGQEVDVRFTYDLNGVLEVEATVVKTKQTTKQVITRHVRGLSEAEIARAVADMQSLKTHPREELANRHALRRAERIFAELPPRERQVLTELLDGFESAMELGERDAIEAHRGQLEEFLNLVEPQEGDESSRSEDDF